MNKITILLAAMAVLCGCSQRALFSSAPGIDREASFDCTRTDGASASQNIVETIGPDRDGKGLVLMSDSGPRQLLTPVASNSGRLFASPLYAWKSTGSTGVLTDVENIQSYNCREITPPGTVPFPSWLRERI